MAEPRPSLLDGLSDHERRAVLATCTRRRYRKGEVLFHAGEPGDTLHLIDKGHVAIRGSTPRGDIATFTVLSPGDMFGEQALLDPNTIRTASAVALDAVETRIIDRAHFAALRDTHPHIDRFLLDIMSATIRRLSEQLIEALYIPADIRVLRRVLQLGRDYSTGSGTVTIPLTQDDLASMAGIARATTNRILCAAQADGILTISRGHLEVLDLELLTRRAR